MDSVTEREARLEQFNKALNERGLKNLSKLGDASKDEIELVRLKEVYDHSKRFYTDVKFDCIFPGGKTGEFTIRFNANGAVSDGAVIIAVVNGKFAIVKQWRPVLGCWTYEVPRGFGEKMDKAHLAGSLGQMKIGDLPLGTMARELGEEVMETAEVVSVTHLGNVAQNSGTDAVAPSYFLVVINADEDAINKKLKNIDGEVSKVYLWDSTKVKSEVGRRINDNHSIVALTLAMNHIAQLPRL